MHSSWRSCTKEDSSREHPPACGHDPAGADRRTGPGANNKDIVTIRAVVLNKRYDTRSILVYFGPLADIPPEQMYLKTYSQSEARTVSCSPFGQYVWIDHGENVVEKTIRACGTSGQKIQMKVVLDPKAELAEKASERANNIGSGTVTIR